MPSDLAVNVDHVTNTIQSCSHCSTELKDIDIALFALTTSFCSVILTFIPQLSVFHYFFCSLYLKSFAFWNYSLTTACLSSEFLCHKVSSVIDLCLSWPMTYRSMTYWHWPLLFINRPDFPSLILRHIPETRYGSLKPVLSTSVSCW